MVFNLARDVCDIAIGTSNGAVEMRRNPHFHFSKLFCHSVGCNYLYTLTLIIIKCLEISLGCVIACYLHNEFWLLQQALKETRSSGAFWVPV